jgi:hypothetical protein
LGPVEKSPGFTPEGLIAEIRRNSNCSAEEWRAIVSDEPIDPKAVIMKLREGLEAAETFISPMPTEKGGLIFLKDGEVVQPDPDILNSYQTHAGQRRGHWPGNTEISHAMLEHYNQKPKE